jgi:hypothetical protein
MVKIRVSSKDKFPNICYLCGELGNKRVKFSDWQQSVEYNDNRFGIIRILFMFATRIFLPISVRLGREGGYERKFTRTKFQLPSCKECKAREVRILDSFPAQSACVVGVHPSLAAQGTIKKDNKALNRIREPGESAHRYADDCFAIVSSASLKFTLFVASR